MGVPGGLRTTRTAQIVAIEPNGSVRVLIDCASHAEIVALAEQIPMSQPAMIGTFVELVAEIRRTYRYGERIIDAVDAPDAIQQRLRSHGYAIGRGPTPAQTTSHFALPPRDDENLAYVVQSNDWAAIRLCSSPVTLERQSDGIVRLNGLRLDAKHPLAGAIAGKGPISFIGSLDGDVFRTFDAQNAELDALTYRDRCRAIRPYFECYAPMIGPAQTSIDPLVKRQWLDELSQPRLWHVRFRRIDALRSSLEELVYGASSPCT